MANPISHYKVDIQISFQPQDRYNANIAGMSVINLTKHIKDALDMVEVIKAVDAITGRESVSGSL